VRVPLGRQKMRPRTCMLEDEETLLAQRAKWRFGKRQLLKCPPLTKIGLLSRI
jgi:hypothetical protein